MNATNPQEAQALKQQPDRLIHCRSANAKVPKNWNFTLINVKINSDWKQPAEMPT